MNILVIGGVSFDSIVYLDTLPAPIAGTVFTKGYHETVGSTGTGKALNLHRLGVQAGFRTTLHAMLGADREGEAICATFAKAGLRFLYDIDPAGTERHINLMSAAGERISLYVRYATFQPEFDLARLDAEIAACDAIALNINNYCRRLIPGAYTHQKPLWIDIHDYDGQNSYHQDFVEAADYLFLSGEKLPDYRQFMATMREAGKQLVVITHGARGSTALTADGHWIETPALTSYPYVDANGAGDSFFAGVMWARLRGDSPERCLRVGSILGGLTISVRELVHPDLNDDFVRREYRRHFGVMAL